jgi:hypothetical protein
LFLTEEGRIVPTGVMTKAAIREGFC